MCTGHHARVSTGFITILFFTLICALWLSPAHASVEQAEDYFSQLESFRAEFTQTTESGVISHGKFYLKRPQKMRWEYSPPTPVLMVTRGNFLTYYDYDLDQVSDVPLDETLFSILTEKEVPLTGDDTPLEVVESSEKDGIFSMVVQQKEHPERGKISFIFNDSPFQLTKFHITDATGMTTQVDFHDIQENQPIEDDVFEFRDPRIGGTNKKSAPLER